MTLAFFVWTASLAARSISALSRVAEALWAIRFVVLTFCYLALVTVALIRFWDYWRTLL